MNEAGLLVLCLILLAAIVVVSTARLLVNYCAPPPPPHATRAEFVQPVRVTMEQHPEAILINVTRVRTKIEVEVEG